MDPRNPVGFVALPPVSLSFALLQIAIYFANPLYISYPEDIWVSWQKVVEEGEWWRLMVAQYHHFTRAHLFWSIVTLMTVGRFLEKKLTMGAMLVVINLNGVVSNIVFVCLDLIICPPEQGVKLSEISYGFTSVLYSLRMVHSFCKQPPLPNAEGGIDPVSVLGFFPVYMPDWLAPFVPLLEVSFMEVFLGGICSTLNVSGIIAGLLFPSLSFYFPEFVYRQPPYRL